jgi:hypothetical protein
MIKNNEIRGSFKLTETEFKVMLKEANKLLKNDGTLDPGDLVGTVFIKLRRVWTKIDSEQSARLSYFRKTVRSCFFDYCKSKKRERERVPSYVNDPTSEAAAFSYELREFDDPSLKENLLLFLV